MLTRLLLYQSIQQLGQNGVDAPRKDAELMLMAAWAISQTSLMIKMVEDVPNDVFSRFNELMKRRLKREPLAYILGVKAFWKNDFLVTSDVLVPRPETEHLIEMVLKYIPHDSSFSRRRESIGQDGCPIKELGHDTVEPLQICDIGTGSGCIAITLAIEYQNSFVMACDISDAALVIAKENAKQIGVLERMSFYQGDLYQALPDGVRFDVIASNPPYVSQDEMNDLEAELGFEPRFALTDESTGLTLLEKLLQDAHRYLNDGGLLVLESGLCGMPDAPKTLKKLEGYQDLAGNFRGTVFQKI